jgi:hypothetical protein
VKIPKHLLAAYLCAPVADAGVAPVSSSGESIATANAAAPNLVAIVKGIVSEVGQTRIA